MRDESYWQLIDGCWGGRVDFLQVCGPCFSGQLYRLSEFKKKEEDMKLGSVSGAVWEKLEGVWV